MQSVADHVESDSHALHCGGGGARRGVTGSFSDELTVLRSSEGSAKIRIQSCEWNMSRWRSIFVQLDFVSATIRITFQPQHSTPHIPCAGSGQASLRENCFSMLCSEQVNHIHDCVDKSLYTTTYATSLLMSYKWNHDQQLEFSKQLTSGYSISYERP